MEKSDIELKFEFNEKSDLETIKTVVNNQYNKKQCINNKNSTENIKILLKILDKKKGNSLKPRGSISPLAIEETKAFVKGRFESVDVRKFNLIVNARLNNSVKNLNINQTKDKTLNEKQNMYRNSQNQSKWPSIRSPSPSRKNNISRKRVNNQLFPCFIENVCSFNYNSLCQVKSKESNLLTPAKLSFSSGKENPKLNFNHDKMSYIKKNLMKNEMNSSIKIRKIDYIDANQQIRFEEDLLEQLSSKISKNKKKVKNMILSIKKKK